jgi:hypothetical protein
MSAPCHSPVSSGRRTRAGSQHGSIPDLELPRRPCESAIWNMSVDACQESEAQSSAEKRTPDAGRRCSHCSMRSRYGSESAWTAMRRVRRRFCHSGAPSTDGARSMVAMPVMESSKRRCRR